MSNALSDRLSGLAGKAKEKAVDLRESVRHNGGSEDGGSAVIEQIEAGVPVKVAYQEWTHYTDFPDFLNMAKSEVVAQVPKERIVWRTKGRKGYVEGAVTFHELAPQLARIVVVLERHPKGLIERTGDLLRPSRHQVRSGLKNFQRHVMADCVLHAPEAGQAGKSGKSGKSGKKRTKSKGASR